jgi:hypothetical protein
VPPARSDRRLLLLTGALVVLAGAVFAAALFFATGGGQAAPKPGPVYIGLERDLRSRIVKDHQPLYFAHPFGGTGIWLALEDNRLVPLVARRPGAGSCTVAWKPFQHAYIDCRGRRLSSRELDRYQLSLPQLGAEAGGVIVDFRHVEPAPAPLPA